jgi:response regulator RpfG family c-di-GMP phosphodiesterase
MSEHKIGCVVVTEEDGTPVGILSERDIISRVVAVGAIPLEVRVRDCMTTPLISCQHGTPMHQVREMMDRAWIRHLPVVQDGAVVAMISSREVIADQLWRDRRMRNLTIFALAKLAECRDQETGGHLERVQRYVVILAGEMFKRGLSPEVNAKTVRLIYDSCPLHDIGKVGIPDGVLFKPGRLTAEEREIMKTHCRRGAETIDLALVRFPNEEFLRIGRRIAAWHHERYDGEGYPDGLAGCQIPLCTRIFSVVDVYDALVSWRVYKSPVPHETAVDVIARGAGTQFDPDIVEAFLGCQDRFAAIRKRYHENVTVV